MSRRSKNILEELVELPWWASVIASAIVYVGARWIVPGVSGEQPSAKAFGQTLKTLAPYLALLFLLPAPIAAFRAWRRNAMLGKSREWGSVAGMPWDDFERLLATAYRRMGYEVEERGGGGADGGIDLVLREPGKTTLVQCKHWNRSQVGVGIIRELYGVMNAEVAEEGIVVTSGYFSLDAEAFARGKSIELIDGPRLRTLLSYARSDEAQATAPVDDRRPAPPSCPKCNGPMVMRMATRGSTAGKQFWGCSRFPECTGSRSL